LNRLYGAGAGAHVDGEELVDREQLEPYLLAPVLDRPIDLRARARRSINDPERQQPERDERGARRGDTDNGPGRAEQRRLREHPHAIRIGAALAVARLAQPQRELGVGAAIEDRKSTRLNSS